MRTIDIRRYGDGVETLPSQIAEDPRPFSKVESGNDGTIITRDPLGQMPVHILKNNVAIYVANTIKDLLPIPGYDYSKVEVIRHGHRANIDGDGTLVQSPYVDFNNYLPEGFEQNKFEDTEYCARYIRKKFDQIMSLILDQKTDIACLLSGGVDSMIATYLTSLKQRDVNTYTMGLASNSEDENLAREYSKAFGCKHNEISVTREEVVDTLKESVWRSEIYHLYNVYCAVGMVVLARYLKQLEVRNVISGEGANEGFGDYHNWDMKQDAGSVRIQSTDIVAFNSPKGRHAYVWGNPNSENQGFFNQQLGSGLAKHGTSRMYKPMNEYGMQLYSPFMNIPIMKVIASLTEQQLQEVGGKPGFMKLVFSEDIKQGRIPAEFFENRKKTRLQDANPDGKGGITETLYKLGFDQQKVIEIYNTLFQANIKDDSRFTDVKLR